MHPDVHVHAALHHLFLDEGDDERHFQVQLDVLLDHFGVVAVAVLELEVREMRRVQLGDRRRGLDLREP